MYFTSDNALELVSQEENYCTLCIKLKLNCASCVSVKRQASLDHKLKHQRVGKFPGINSDFSYVIANPDRATELKINLQEQ